LKEKKKRKKKRSPELRILSEKKGFVKLKMKHIVDYKKKWEITDLIRQGKLFPQVRYNRNEKKEIRDLEIERWKYESEGCPHGKDCFLLM